MSFVMAAALHFGGALAGVDALGAAAGFLGLAFAGAAPAAFTIEM